MDMKFRENWNTRTVEFIIDGKVVFSNPEYRMTATFAQKQYNLSDAKLMEMYRDYKKDFDS